MDNPPEILDLARRDAKLNMIISTGATVLLGLLSYVVTPNLLIAGVVAIVTHTVLVRVVPKTMAKRYERRYTAAPLTVLIVTPDLTPEREADATVLRLSGFTEVGWYQYVDQDQAAYAPAALAGLHETYGIVAHVGSSKALLSELADGRVLLTANIGTLPIPNSIRQGRRGAALPELMTLHTEKLRELHSQGISARHPAGGATEALLRVERAEQELLRANGPGSMMCLAAEAAKELDTANG